MMLPRTAPGGAAGVQGALHLRAYVNYSVAPANSRCGFGYSDGLLFEIKSRPARPMFVDTLDHCLSCGYSLHGLPDAHRCPECGTAFDRRTRIWRQKSPWKIVAGSVTGFLIFLPFYAAQVLGMCMQLLGTVLGIVVFVALVVVSPAVSIAWAIAAHRRGILVAVKPDGVFIRRGKKSWNIPYAEIAFVSIVDTQPWIQRRGAGEQITLTGCFADRREMEAFKRAVEEARALAPQPN